MRSVKTFTEYRYMLFSWMSVLDCFLFFDRRNEFALWIEKGINKVQNEKKRTKKKKKRTNAKKYTLG